MASLAAIAAGAAVIPAAPAAADVVVGVATSNGGLEVTVYGEQDGVSVPGANLPAWLLACSWEAMSRYEVDLYFSQFNGGNPTEEDYENPDPDDPDDNPLNDGLFAADEFRVVFCPSNADTKRVSPGIVVSGVLELWEVGDPVPPVIGDLLIERAIASTLVPVQVGQSAPFGDVDAPLITQLPTWGWIEPAVWQPVSATPAPVFGVTVTATATPTVVSFSGDDETVPCGANEGPAYDFGRDEDAQSSDCTIVFSHSSAVGEYELSSTIAWDISWVCSDVCVSGSLPDPFLTTRIRPVRVAELQAVGT